MAPPAQIYASGPRLPLLLVLLLAAGCTPAVPAAPREAQPAAEPVALTVAVAPVASRPITSRLLASGSVSAWRELAIGSEASGLAVAEIAVEENQAVKRGDLLVRLNDAALRAQIAEQEALLDEAAATLESARTELERATTLVATRAISQQTVDERGTSVKTAQAKLNAANAVRAQLEVALARTRILAPDDGLVVKRSVSLGQVVSTGTELVRMIQNSRLQVEAAVAEGELISIEPGDGVRVVDPAGRALAATVREIAPSVDAASRLGSVRIDLPAGTGLRPGMFVRVEIDAAPQMALSVPREALVWRNAGAGVFVVGPGERVELTPIVTGRQMDGVIEVVSGLAGGEKVVSDGAGFLNDGDRVRVEAAAAQAGQPEGAAP